MGMKHLIYHDPARATINLALPWHSSAEEIAVCNFNIIMGKLNKCMKSLNPVTRPWAAKGFLVVPSKPPPTEQTVEDQPFFSDS